MDEKMETTHIISTLSQLYATIIHSNICDVELEQASKKKLLEYISKL
jgi:hypothetical protein